MMFFRDVKNLERFSLVVQSITRLALAKFQQLPDHLLQEQQQQQLAAAEPRPPDPGQQAEAWSLEDVEKLVSYLSRLDTAVLMSKLVTSTTGVPRIFFQ